MFSRGEIKMSENSNEINDFLIKKISDDDKKKTHCCEYENGILHHLCMQLCKVETGLENCNYQFQEEYIVINYDVLTDVASSELMTWKKFLKWKKANKIIRIGDISGIVD